PPDTFSIVETGIYRSENIKPNHFSYLKYKTINSLIMLSEEAPSKTVSNFLAENQIQLFHLGNKKSFKVNLSWKPLSEDLVKEGLELVMEPRLHPILITCTSGIHETGAFVGCLRKLQDWNFNSIVVEYRNFAKSKSRLVIEHFIELFDLDLLNLP
ncbi:protein-tyrosine phosphatase, partial [Neoconidiobolus thromboides FSU 785]